MSTQFGATFSHIHAKQLGLNPRDAFEILCVQGYNPIRLCVYWNEVESISGAFDFSAITELLTIAEKRHIEILCTVGVKAPRWPEFYWPEHVKVKNFVASKTQQHIFRFIQAAITELKHFSCITHWQVENEPLDPSGPDNTCIPLDFYIREVQLVRSLDSRPILGTLWGNDLVKRNLLPHIETHVDIIGIDLYPKQLIAKKWGTPWYRGPSQKDSALEEHVQNCSKPVWITELQAEPWEPGSLSEREMNNIIAWARTFSAHKVLLWGVEYQQWKTHSFLRIPFFSKLLKSLSYTLNTGGLQLAAQQILVNARSRMDIIGKTDAIKSVLTSKPCVVVANHPTSASVIALLSALEPRKDMYLIISSKFVGGNPVFDQYLIPAYIQHNFKNTKYNPIITAISGRYKPELSSEQEHILNIESISHAQSIVESGGVVVLFPGYPDHDEGGWYSGVGHLLAGIKRNDVHVVIAHIAEQWWIEYLRLIPRMGWMLPRIKIHFLTFFQKTTLKKLQPKSITQKIERLYWQSVNPQGT